MFSLRSARRPMLLAVLVALPALLAGCTGALDAAAPVGEAEAAHAGFDCPAGAYVVGFEASGRPKCRVFTPPPVEPMGLDDCGYGEAAGRGAGLACLPWLQFLERMEELEGSAIGDVHDHAPGSITPLMLEGGIDAQLVDPTQIQLRVLDECPAGEAMVRIHENGVVDCEAIVAAAGGGAVDSTLVQSRVTGDCPSNSFVQRVHEDGSVDCGSVVGPSGNGAVQTTDLAQGAVTSDKLRPNIAEVKGAAKTLLNAQGPQKLAQNATITVPQGATPHKVLVLVTLRASCRYCPEPAEIRVSPSFVGTLRVGATEARLWVPADPEANGQTIHGHKAPLAEGTLAFVQNVYGGATTLEFFASGFPRGANANFQPPRAVEPQVEVASVLVIDLGVA